MAKHRNKHRLLRSQVAATPTKERCHQNGGIICETIAADPNSSATVQRYRARWASPLEAYRDLQLIDPGSYQAGMQFHRAYYGEVLCRKPDTRPTNQEQAVVAATLHEKLLKQAYAILPVDSVNVVIDVCGHSHPLYSPKALEKLRKGLGHLSLQWNMAAMEFGDHKKD